MAMTKKQITTFLSRLSTGEHPRAIREDMQIERLDFHDWKEANYASFRVARKAGAKLPGAHTREERLTRLQRKKVRIQARSNRAASDMAVVDAEIAEVEAE